MMAEYFDTMTLDRQSNGIQHTVVHEQVGGELVAFARIADRTRVDGRVHVWLERASGIKPKGTIKDIHGRTVYWTSVDGALETLNVMRAVGAL